jgi:endonuclease/exonuclease/phosphatase (EEP) superfamily protein YafD
MKIIEWNIGGAILKNKLEDISFFGSVLQAQNPDIIILFETHSQSKGSSQARALANGLGYTYYHDDKLSESHLKPGQMLSQSIISRYSLVDHTFHQFSNPNLKGTHHDKVIKTHDKGVSSFRVDVDGTWLKVQFLHAIPFIPFNVDSGSALMRTITADMESFIDKDSTPNIIVGDFNINDDDLLGLFPVLKASGFKEAENRQPTLSNGNRLDRILYKGLSLSLLEVIENNETQHYPVIALLDIIKT